MIVTFVAPEFNATAFTCPHCHVLAQQTWVPAYASDNMGLREIYKHHTCVCTHCKEEMIWVKRELIYPRSLTGPIPNEDLSDNVKTDFDEARRIASDSPRGAAALLRLCIQKLCIELGESGRKIDDDIASLVKQGLPVRIQQALDIVRVVGNECVHPGTIDLSDDGATVVSLFELVNMICENQISEPKRTEAMFITLPPKKLEAIRDRDKAK